MGFAALTVWQRSEHTRLLFNKRCAGPGTGLAPFLGFLEELQWFQKRSDKAPGALPNLLLFGCRDENVDFIHRDTLEVQLLS